MGDAGFLRRRGRSGSAHRPTPDVHPAAAAAAPTSPWFNPARESPSLPRRRLGKRKRRPRRPPRRGPGAILGLEKSGRQHRADGGCGAGWVMPRSTQGTAAEGERGTPTPPRTPRSRPGDRERGSVPPEA